MKKDIVIKVENVSKDFKLPHQKKNSLKSVFTGLTADLFSKDKKSDAFETQHALKNITFDIKKGEFFGIVGRNGSGKSTLLKILAGIYTPNKGSVSVEGKLVPFIELGVGFNPELTGRENVYLNGALLGFTHQKIEAMYDDIVEFAEIEKFMDQKLKNYSSGMQVRLAFSMAIRADADILLVDEVLAVGDADFQRKCFDYFRQLKKNKKTVVFVTHDMSAVVEYCDRALLINESKVVAISNANDISTRYTRMFNTAEKEKVVKGSKRWGDGKVKIIKTTIAPEVVQEKDTQFTIEVEFIANETAEDPIVGFLIKNAAGQHLTGTNTKVKKLRLGAFDAGQKGKITWTIPNIFGDGKYLVDVAVSKSDGVSQHDWIEDALAFRAYNPERTPYSINPQVSVENSS